MTGRSLERLLPWGTRLFHGAYFRLGVDRPGCRAIHRAAARGTLYGFGPPPPLMLRGRGDGRRAGDEYRFRSPFAGQQGEHVSSLLWHWRRNGSRSRLVVLNHGTGPCALFVGRALAARVLASGVDVAMPIAAGFCARRHPPGPHGAWNRTVGSALAGIVRRVHDNVAIESWARGQGYRTVTVAGLGVGGTVAALLGATTARFDAYVPMLAGAHPGRLWAPPRTLARAVARRALARGGVRRTRTLVRLFNPVAPACLPRPRSREQCTVVGLRFDTMVPPRDVHQLATHWGITPLWIPRSRVELLRCVGDLAAIVLHATARAASGGGPPTACGQGHGAGRGDLSQPRCDPSEALVQGSSRGPR